MKTSNKSGFYEEIYIKPNAYFNGIEYPLGETFVKSKSFRPSREKEVFGIKSELTPEQQEDAILCLKDTKLQEVSDANQIALRTALEYPAESGKIFSISNDDGRFQDFNAMVIRASALPFPYVYSQGVNHVVLNSPQEIIEFDTAAQTAYFIVNTTRYQPAVNAIENVTIEGSGSFDQAVNDLLAIEY